MTKFINPTPSRSGPNQSRLRYPAGIEGRIPALSRALAQELRNNGVSWKDADSVAGLPTKMALYQRAHKGSLRLTDLLALSDALPGFSLDRVFARVRVDVGRPFKNPDLLEPERRTELDSEVEQAVSMEFDLNQ